MAIALRGTPQVASTTDGLGVTITFDVAPQEGDVVIVHGGHGAAVTTLTAPGSGYTEVYARTGAAPVWGIWYKVMGSAPDTGVVCSGSGSVIDATGYVSYVMSGVDNANVLDTARTVASGSSGVIPNSPSITTTTDNAWVFSIVGTDAHDTSVTGPSGYSTPISASSNDSNDLATHSAYLEIATAGAEDPGAYSFISRNEWDAITVAIREDQGGAPPSGGMVVGDDDWWRRRRILTGHRNRK